MVGSSNKGKMVLPRRYLLGGGTAMLFNYTGDILRSLGSPKNFRSNFSRNLAKVG